MDKRKILIVEDNEDLAANICEFFEEKPWEIDHIVNGFQALEAIQTRAYDLVVLDIGLPGLDGLTITQDVCQNEVHPPILHLSARKRVSDRIKGLDAGADDYLIKPFSLMELQARMEALLRRNYPKRVMLQVEDLVVDVSNKVVMRQGQPVKLNPIGFQILVLLMQHSPTLVDRETLEKHLWPTGQIPNSDSLRSNIYLLRQSVDKPFDRALIHTQTGQGWSIG